MTEQRTEQVLQTIKDQPSLSAQELADIIGVGKGAIYSSLRTLTAGKRVRSAGMPRRYVVADATTATGMISVEYRDVEQAVRALQVGLHKGVLGQASEQTLARLQSRLIDAIAESS